MGKTILIVDDSESLRQVVSIALKDAGYDVIEACDGVDGLQKLAGNKVNLIVSDVNMPNMDGIAMVKKIKQMADYKFTPIIMLTRVDLPAPDLPKTPTNSPWQKS